MKARSDANEPSLIDLSHFHRRAKWKLGACLTTCVSVLLVWGASASATVRGYEVVGVTNQPVAAGATGAALASCPAGKRVLGGGVYTGHDAMRVIESFPSADSGWFGAVSNGGDANVLDIYAVCAELDAKARYEVVGVTNRPVAAGMPGGAVATCPQGKRVLGGGVYAGHDAMTVVESFPSRSGWSAAVYNGGDANVFDVYAVCARLDAKARYEVAGVTNQPVGAGETGVAGASCPDGKRVLGGGISTGHDATRVIESFPSAETGWFAAVSNGGGASVLDVYAICAVVANLRPVVEFIQPFTGQPFSFGDTVEFDVFVSDDTPVDCANVSVGYLLAHDTHRHEMSRTVGCTGSIQTFVDSSHAEATNLSAVFTATYTDTPADPNDPALTGNDEVVLLPTP